MNPGSKTAPLKLVMVGYGKMGKAIEEIAVQRGHSILLRIDENNLGDFTKEQVQSADLAIEFTNPHSAFQNVKSCLEWNIPVVCGTTGWLDRMDEIQQLCAVQNGALIYSSNFSVGVNIFFEVNKKLARLMAAQNEYEVILEETHHTQKKDAPSGTAITLAEEILKQVHRKKRWVNELSDHPEDLEIISQRTDPAPGTHSVRYSSAVDNIEIIHTAHSRKGFAAGVVVAAEFLHGKKGFFTMKEVLGL